MQTLKPSKKIEEISQRSQKMPGGNLDTRQKQTKPTIEMYWALSIQMQEMSWKKTSLFLAFCF